MHVWDEGGCNNLTSTERESARARAVIVFSLSLFCTAYTKRSSWNELNYWSAAEYQWSKRFKHTLLKASPRFDRDAQSHSTVVSVHYLWSMTVKRERYVREREREREDERVNEWVQRASIAHTDKRSSTKQERDSSGKSACFHSFTAGKETSHRKWPWSKGWLICLTSFSH